MPVHRLIPSSLKCGYAAQRMVAGEIDRLLSSKPTDNSGPSHWLNGWPLELLYGGQPPRLAHPLLWQAATGESMQSLPVAEWMETLERMAAQTAAWLNQVEQAQQQEVTRVAEGAATSTIDLATGSAADPATPYRWLVEPPAWEQLLQLADSRVQDALDAINAIQDAVDQWHQRYAAWLQLQAQIRQLPGNLLADAITPPSP
ncbi:MAG: hypothetical protein NZ703_00765 [Gemmataceae bacterium]|nr:hypothetical protein [Gemmataceae bacterium]